jgi:hypothetical protein
MALRKLGHPLIARDHFERALEIATAAFGENHPDVARDCASLAELMREMGDDAAAHGYDARAAGIRLSLASQKEAAIDSSLVGMES